MLKWNVMPLKRRGSYFYFFAAFYFYCLGFNALLASPMYEGLQWGHWIQEGSNKVLLRNKKYCPNTNAWLMALFNKMDSRSEVKFTSSDWKHTSSAWKWYYSFSRVIFSFGEFFRSKQFFKNCGSYYIRGPN